VDPDLSVTVCVGSGVRAGVSISITSAGVSVAASVGECSMTGNRNLRDYGICLRPQGRDDRLIPFLQRNPLQAKQPVPMAAAAAGSGRNPAVPEAVEQIGWLIPPPTQSERPPLPTVLPNFRAPAVAWDIPASLWVLPG
jgi:hypothetical protein